MKEAYYFSHDANARNDPKISAMRSVYGTEGYGRYWIIVEMLREEADYRLPLDKYTDHTLAVQMQCERMMAAQFLHDCINEFRLFKSDGKWFWSDSLCRRMAQRDEKAKKAQAAAHMRWESERKANAKRTQSERNAIKGKEKKDKEIEIAPHEQTILDEFAQIANYPLDTEKDLAHIRKLTADFPRINLLVAVKDWSTYKLDKPLEGKSNPRSQFRTWVSRVKPTDQAARETDGARLTADYMSSFGTHGRAKP